VTIAQVSVIAHPADHLSGFTHKDLSGTKCGRNLL